MLPLLQGQYLAGTQLHVQHRGRQPPSSGILFDEDIDEQVLVKHLKNLFYNRANVEYIKFISKTLVNLSHLYSILDKGLFSPQLPVTYYFLIR